MRFLAEKGTFSHNCAYFGEFPTFWATNHLFGPPKSIDYALIWSPWTPKSIEYSLIGSPGLPKSIPFAGKCFGAQKAHFLRKKHLFAEKLILARKNANCAPTLGKGGKGAPKHLKSIGSIRENAKVPKWSKKSPRNAKYRTFPPKCFLRKNRFWYKRSETSGKVQKSEIRVAKHLKSIGSISF